MSRLQEHILPSVDTVIKLLAFWVPTTFTQYTGCYTDTHTDTQTDEMGEDASLHTTANETICFHHLIAVV